MKALSAQSRRQSRAGETPGKPADTAALRVGISTVKRWHEEALKQVRMPEHPLRITQGDAR